MNRTLIQNIKETISQIVQIKGWVETIRQLKKMWFIVIRDYTGVVQVTYQTGTDTALDQIVSELTPESAVSITGKVVENSYVRLNGIEIIPDKIEVMSLSEAQLPLDKTTAIDHRLQWRFLDLRQPEHTLIFKVQTAVQQAMRDFWKENDFVEIHTPKLMGSASESGAEVFEVKYFDKKAYLAQSPQFYKQMAMAAGFDRVFEIGPVFRAEESFTSRHLTEYTSIDSEISWIESEEDIMQFLEKFLHHVISAIKKKYGEKVKEAYDVDIQIPQLPFPRLTMQEAHEVLKQREHVLAGDDDLDSKGEQMLADYIAEKFNHAFVFVTDYPWSVRPFYHQKSDTNPAATKSFDLLWKGLEITTGAKRENRYDILIAQAKEKGLFVEPIQDYLNCFRFGCPPHGGFGMGLERVIRILLGLKSIHEVVFLSRTPHRITP